MRDENIRKFIDYNRIAIAKASSINGRTLCSMWSRIRLIAISGGDFSQPLRVTVILPNP